jgi:hypothetical protein
MISTFKYAAIAVALIGSSAAYADSTGWQANYGGWSQDEWRYPPQDRPGYENQSGCQPGTHGVPAPNGNGFRCVQNGW